MSSAQFTARAALEAMQLEKLRRLFAAILPENRFYARKLAAGGFAAERLAALGSLAELALLPLTTKEELQADQEAAPPYGSNLSFPLARYTRLHLSSGTSGRPLAWLDTPESWDCVLRSWERIQAAAGVHALDRFFVPASFGPFLGFWGAFEGALRGRHFTLAGGGMSSAARLRAIVEHAITVVACTPTYGLRLLEASHVAGVDLRASTVRLLIVAGEPGGNVLGIRRRLEEGWGARVIDHWGMTEAGPLGFEPIRRPGGIHLLETECIAEVVDPASGRPLESEGRGELVITTLARLGSPLLRYRTGDLVHFAPSNSSRPVPDEGESERGFSGSDLTGKDLSGKEAATESIQEGYPFLRFEGGILGRVDHMVSIRGNNVYPAAIEAVLGLFHEVVEYRAEVREDPSGRRLLLKLECDERRDETQRRALVAKVIEAVRERLFFRPEAILVPSGSLPRSEFKSQRFVVLPPES